MQDFIGQIILFAGAYVPLGWAACDGTLLAISGNEALFALLGTTWGGDGRTTFALPDLRGRLPIGSGTGANPALTPHTLAQSGGAEGVTLALATVPVHTHSFNASAVQATTNVPTGNVLASLPGKKVYYADPPSPLPTGAGPFPLGSDTVSLAGITPASHENRMPSLAITYLICLQGIFPPES